MTADKSSLAFGSVNVGSSSSAQTITITHAHADKITASISGTNASDFSVSATTPVSNSTTQGTKEITVTFSPTCNGPRSATLTLHSSYTGLSDVTITLSGTGVLIANPLAVEATSKDMKVDDEWKSVITTNSSDGTISTTSTKAAVATYDVTNNKIIAHGEGSATITINQAASCQYVAASKTINVSVSKYDQTLEWTTIEENMLLGATQDIVATASSGLSVTYTTSDDSKVSVSGNRLTAAGIGSAVITASQPGNYKYNAATPIIQTVNVFNKEVPEFTPSFSGTTCDLLVDGTATIELANVSDGLNGDFTAVPSDGTVVSVTRSGNTLTIKGLKQGSTTVTLHQKENDGIFATNPDPVYTFNVSRVSNTLAVAATSKAMKVDDTWTPVVTSKNSNATVETTSSRDTVATYNAATNTITAHREGSTTIVISQAQNVKYTAASCTISVTVTKYDNTLAVAATSYSKKVDDSWSCAVSSINSDAAINVTTNTTTDSLTATYNSSTKAIDLNARKAGVYTVTFTQPATYKYKGVTRTVTVDATKYSNAITVRLGGSVRNTISLTWGDETAVVLSASNTDYANRPLTITQTSGDASAKYTATNGTTGTIQALPVNGSATWTITQDTTYKYDGATATITVTSAGVAANACYLLQQDAEKSLSTIQEGASMAIASGVKGKLSFEAYYPDIDNWFATQNFFVQYSTDGGSNWLDLAEPTLTGSYKTFTYDIEETATNIRFITKTGATWTKKYKNVRIPRVTYFNASTDFIALSPTVETQKTKTFTLDYSQCDWGDIHVHSTNPKFTVAHSGNFVDSTITVPSEKFATPEITVYCAEDATPADEGYLIVYNKAQKCSVEVRVSRPEPVLTFNPYSNPYFVNTVIPNVCVSENTDYENCPLSYTTSNSSIAFVRNDSLYILDKKQSVTITVSQPENEDFLATTKTFTFTPMDMPDLAVPLVMTEGIFNDALSKEGTASWNSSDNAILLGVDNIMSSFSWGTKSIVFMFHGSPDKISFKYKNSTATTSANFIVQESTNGTKWTTAWSVSGSHTSYTESGEIQLQPNTLYLKLYFSGNYAGFFKDIKITELIGDYYLLDEATDKYLSRGKTWSTRAVEDEYGVPARITRTTPDNTNYYTHLQFYDNRLYLFEDGTSHDIYTDNTTNSSWLMQEQTDGTYTLQSANGVGTNGRSITVSDDILTLTTDGFAATHWTLEHADRHPARMSALQDAQAQAAAAASPDFGSDATWESLNEAMAEFDFSAETLPAVTITEQASVRTNNGTSDSYSYENTVTVAAGLYRLTLEACYRPAPALVAYENRGVTGHENILAYMFANGQKTQIKSIYADGTPVPGSKTNAAACFDAGRFQNYIFLYVADAGDGTGTVHYGLHKPSWVDGDVLWYRNFTLEQITRKEFILDGHGTDEQTSTWATDGNWSDEEQPGSENWAVVRHDAVINTPVSVYGVRIENDAVLNVAPTGGLTVGAGGVVGATAENLVLRAATTGEEKGQTGFLRINPAYTGEMPTARVELYSVGYYDASRGEDNSAAWQYVGSPVTPASTVTLEHTYYGSWVYKWDEQTAEWTTTGNNGKMQPFEGYCTTQKKNADGMMHEYEGQLTSNQTDIIVNLSYHAGHADSQDDGFNLLANSFSAPIDLTQFRTTDFVGDVEPTVYLYNTGSKAQWLALQQSGTLFTQDRGTTAGQYVAVPVGDGATLAALITASSGAVPAVIPPMQGFRVNATGEGATLKLSYNRLVWQGNYTAYGNRPMRVVSSERGMTEEQEMIAEGNEEQADTVIHSVALTLSADGYADRLYLLQSDIYTSDYDRGADAWQINGGMFNLYARSSDNDGRLAVCAADDLSGMQVGIRCDRQRLFTLSCTYATVENLALRDLVTGDLLPLAAGAVYQLQYNELGGEPRFIIEKMENTGSTEQTDVTTSLDAARQQQRNVRIYDVTGKLLRSSKQSDINTMLPAGVYLLQQDNECKKVVRL
ncbi:MAG: hypothetical protein IJS13_09805 [Paludibacteraceae bacterium]|nr:hypothetical protein [Paludibacteraceae bacterium]